MGQRDEDHRRLEEYKIELDKSNRAYRYLDEEIRMFVTEKATWSQEKAALEDKIKELQVRPSLNICLVPNAHSTTEL